jgi:hypothetical protein
LVVYRHHQFRYRRTGTIFEQEGLRTAKRFVRTTYQLAQTLLVEIRNGYSSNGRFPSFSPIDPLEVRVIAQTALLSALPQARI